VFFMHASDDDGWDDDGFGEFDDPDDSDNEEE
jgi:hypothetical protein